MFALHLPPSVVLTRPRLQRPNMTVTATLVEGVKEEALPRFDHKVLKGLWWKERHLTDFESYGQQLDLISLGGIQKRAAMFFIRGIRVEADDEGVWPTFGHDWERPALLWSLSITVGHCKPYGSARMCLSILW